MRGTAADGPAGGQGMKLHGNFVICTLTKYWVDHIKKDK